MLVRADIINREEAPLSFEYGDVQAGAVNDDPAVLVDLTQGPDIHETWHLYINGGIEPDPSLGLLDPAPDDPRIMLEKEDPIFVQRPA